MQAAIADREVNLAVGAFHQSMEIVAEQREVDAEAGGERLALLGLAVAVGVAQFPQVGDAGEQQPIADPHDACRGAAFDFVVAVGENAGVVVDAVAVAVFEQADEFARFGVVV